jgi:pSer/pThr/pTyr-binding forkhead associated (FHA) protein
MVPVRIDFPFRGPRIAHVDSVIYLGRSPTCDIVLAQPGGVSRKHIALINRNGRLFLRDLGSRNGTWINGVRVTDQVPLPERARIRLGIYEFTLTHPVASLFEDDAEFGQQDTLPGIPREAFIDEDVGDDETADMSQAEMAAWRLEMKND